MANKNYSAVSPDKGVGSVESMKGSKADQKDPKFVPAPDNVKKEGMGYGNSAKGGGKGAASHD